MIVADLGFDLRVEGGVDIWDGGIISLKVLTVEV